MPALQLSLSVSAVAVFAAAVGAALIGFAAYRVTVPPVSPGLRWMLTILRGAAIFFLLLLLGGPVLSLRHHQIDNPGILLLVDNSLSMSLRDGTGDRAAQLRSLVRSEPMHGLEQTARVHAVLFDRQARFLAAVSPDSVSCSGAATDLAAAFSFARRSGVGTDVHAVILLSDGVSTEGPNPVYDAEALGAPVFAMGIGDTAEQRDVLVRAVRTNDIAYVGIGLPVHAVIHASGFDGARAEVVLRRGNRTLDRARLTLAGSSQDQDVTLSVVPDTEGRQLYTVEISPLRGELTERNNRSDVSVDVLRSKMRLVMVAGGPGPDEAFLRRSLEGDKNLTVRTFTETATGAFSEGPLNAAALQSIDALVLVGYPRAQSSAEGLGLLAQAINAGTPVFVILGRTVDPVALQTLSPLLPFTLHDPETAELQLFAAVPESKRLHAVLRLPEGVPSDAWNALAPIFRWQSGIAAKPESEILATVRIQNVALAEPMIVIRNVSRHRSVAVTGYGLWRWKMLGDAASGTDRVYDAFARNVIRWLTTREEQRRVRIHPIHSVVTTAEAAEFTAEVYDESYRPIDRAAVSLAISGAGRTWESPFAPLGNGVYSASVGPLPEGSFTARASASSGGKVIGEDASVFNVGSVTAEYLDTRMNRPLLQSLGAKTGGAYFDAPRIGDLVRAVQRAPGMVSRDVVISSDSELWHAGWMLGIMIALIAVEWILRKRNGMM